MMQLVPWVCFVALVLGMLALDLGVFNRTPHAVTMRESLAWTAVWIAVSMLFNVFLYFAYEHHWLGIGETVGHAMGGRSAAIEFFTGYVIEKTLSVDNIFVIALIFSHFRVPAEYQHRTLFWGIIGALMMRGIMIAAGATLIANFTWTVYLFGVLLLYTAVRMMRSDHEEVDPDRSLIVKTARKIYPVAKDFAGDRFFTRIDGRRAMTPLFIALLTVEGADVLFAIDSIPAIFAVTSDPFVVFTSNIFAILGLRALYFTLAAAIHRFRYIQSSLVFLLAFIGVKMLLHHHFLIPAWVSLSVIGGILSVGVSASLWENWREAHRK
jgi:tellurite resistance protein TerC